MSKPRGAYLKTRRARAASDERAKRGAWMKAFRELQDIDKEIELRNETVRLQKIAKSAAAGGK